MSEKPGRVEEFVVSGDTVVAKIKELLHEGGVRRLSLQNEEGRTLIEVRGSSTHALPSFGAPA